ncbi:unnamed protein product [Cylicostephanus goldi]|uniref:Sema domain-containing protein n=1 Tax=Cylicostephanus goldi TaxID=71465 RepID=A0A3P7MVQ9_CYLGO|nr:unnamed protein product [Cylicostephanus goldi]
MTNKAVQIIESVFFRSSHLLLARCCDATSPSDSDLRIASLRCARSFTARLLFEGAHQPCCARWRQVRGVAAASVRFPWGLSRLNSPLCNVDGSSCLKDAVLRETDNHNKILQILPSGLLQCGSVRQVAASFSGDSPYRDPFPAVALRELPSFSVVNSGSLEGEAAVFLRAEVRTSFAVQYLSIFHHQHYVYIAAVQSQDTRKTRGAPKVAKLLRFCDNDTR